MTSENISHEFNRVNEEIEQTIQAEIRRLRSMGFSKAYICERSFEIEDGMKARLWRSASIP